MSGKLSRNRRLRFGSKVPRTSVKLFASEIALLSGGGSRLISGAHPWRMPDEHAKTASDRHRFRRGVPVVLYRQAPHRKRAGADAGCASGDQLATVFSQSLGAARGHRPRRVSHREIWLGRGLHEHRRAGRHRRRRRGAELPARPGAAPAQHHRLPSADSLGGRVGQIRRDEATADGTVFPRRRRSHRYRRAGAGPRPMSGSMPPTCAGGWPPTRMSS